MSDLSAPEQDTAGSGVQGRDHNDAKPGAGGHEFLCRFPSVPYPGLRAFDEGDEVIFFGRDFHTDALIERLHNHRLVAVVGASGSGKSSLVRAGLLPALRTGLLTTAGPNWCIAKMRPGTGPREALVQALDKAFREVLGEGATGANEAVTDGAALIRSRLSGDAPLALPDLAARLLPREQDTNLLILVDQFEEIFRYRKRGAAERAETEAFVDLLLEAVTQRRVPVYVVLTMRSDFLGECIAFPDLPGAMNDCQFLTPSLRQVELREVITEPPRFFGWTVEPGLVDALIADQQKINEEADHLPLLQHALLHLWHETINRHGPDAPENLRRLTLQGYQALVTGGEGSGTRMQSILDTHAELIYDNLPDETHREIAECLFRAISARTSGKAIRDPQTKAVVSDIVKQTVNAEEGGDAALGTVMAAYRLPTRSFLFAIDAGEPLPPDAEVPSQALLDVSHEALLRGWRRLRDWIADEDDARELYKRLERDAALEAKRPPRASLWTGATLAGALEWRKRRKPNPAWVRRLHAPASDATTGTDGKGGGAPDDVGDLSRAKGELDPALHFLERSRLRAIRRVLFSAFASAVAVIGLLALYLDAQHARSRAEVATANQERLKNEAQNAASVAEEAKEKAIAAARSQGIAAAWASASEEKAKASALSARKSEMDALKAKTQLEDLTRNVQTVNKDLIATLNKIAEKDGKLAMLKAADLPTLNDALLIGERVVRSLTERPQATTVPGPAGLGLASAVASYRRAVSYGAGYTIAGYSPDGSRLVLLPDRGDQAQARPTPVIINMERSSTTGSIHGRPSFEELRNPGGGGSEAMQFEYAPESGSVVGYSSQKLLIWDVKTRRVVYGPIFLPKQDRWRRVRFGVKGTRLVLERQNGFSLLARDADDPSSRQAPRWSEGPVVDAAQAQQSLAALHPSWKLTSPTRFGDLKKIDIGPDDATVVLRLVQGRYYESRDGGGEPTAPAVAELSGSDLASKYRAQSVLVFQIWDLKRMRRIGDEQQRDNYSWLPDEPSRLAVWPNADADDTTSSSAMPVTLTGTTKGQEIRINIPQRPNERIYSLRLTRDKSRCLMIVRNVLRSHYTLRLWDLTQNKEVASKHLSSLSSRVPFRLMMSPDSGNDQCVLINTRPGGGDEDSEGETLQLATRDGSIVQKIHGGPTSTKLFGKEYLFMMHGDRPWLAFVNSRTGTVTPLDKKAEADRRKKDTLLSGGPHFSVVLSEDESFALQQASNGSIQLWDLNRRRPIGEVAGGGRPHAAARKLLANITENSFQAAPDGRSLTGSYTVAEDSFEEKQVATLWVVLANGDDPLPPGIDGTRPIGRGTALALLNAAAAARSSREAWEMPPAPKGNTRRRIGVGRLRGS
jgi:hypothetical protein